MRSNVLSRIFTRRQRTCSVEGALAALFSKSDLALVLKECSDPRELVSTVSLLTTQPEEHILALVAEQLGEKVIARVPPIDLLSLPQELSLEKLEEVGAIPFAVKEKFVGWVCCDPGLVRELLPMLPGRTWLGSYRKIREALELSRDLYNRVQLEQQAKELRDARQLALRALQLIAEESRGHGASRILISVQEQGVSYRFQTSSGKEARGSVHPKAKDAVQSFLFENNECENFLLALPHFRTAIFRPREKEVELLFEEVSSQQVLPSVDQNAESDHPKLALVKAEQVEEQRKEPDREVDCSLQEAVAASRVGSGQKVLIIDDNEVFTLVLTRFFGRLDLASVSARDGKQAIALMQQLEESPAAIVCDVHMPNMNGIELVKRVRAIELLADVPIVMLTSDENVETELELIEAGADAFLKKSQDPRLLTAYVNRLIRKQKAA